MFLTSQAVSFLLGFLKRTLGRYRIYADNDRLILFFLIMSAVLLFSFKTSSGQGQTTILGHALEGYIEETAAFVDLISEPEENDFFLNPVPLAQGNDDDYSNNVFQDSFLPYQTIVSVFDNGQRNQVIEYTVQPGDNLSQIANDFGISANSLIWANNLKDSDYLSPGQELKIPPVSGVIHIVKSGDSVQSIAKKYSASEEKIFEFNGLPKDGSLKLGEEVMVPDGKIQVAGRSVAYSSSVRFARLPDLGGFLFLPVQGYNWGRIHGRNGVDIANLCGTPVYAAAAGSVIAATESGWNGGAGKYVKIIHNSELDTLYAHLSRVLILPGETVARGQLIGLMGSTGRSTGCHLHFEVHGARNPYARI
jgi:murein DD-endopeptidase MepM/ murein hydrolase activator NlpD